MGRVAVKGNATDFAAGTEIGDEIYFQHASGPACAPVRAIGRHGVTVHHENKPHKVKWENVLGHKKRAPVKYTVIDEGEDGAIVGDAAGKKKFLRIDPSARLGDMVLDKSLRGNRMILFAKANGAPPGPGLSRKQITDKNGVQVNKWVRTNPDQANPREDGGDALPSHVGFSHGEFKGHGKVVASGADGHQVEDSKGAVHNIPHGAVTHQWHGDDKPTASPHDPDLKSVKSPLDDGDDSRSADEISHALFDTSETETLPAKAVQPVDSWEQLSAKAPEALKEFKGMLDGVAKSLKLVTGKRPQSFDHAVGEEKSKAEKKGRAPEDLKEEDYMLPEHWGDEKGYLFMGPLKGEDRAKEKVNGDYNGDWSQVKDMVRATIAVPMVSQIPKVLAQLKAAGMELAQKPKNNLIKPLPGGYRDINLIVKTPSGLLAELQIHIKPMTLAKEKGHKHYEDSRSVEAKYAGTDIAGDKSKWEHADAEKHQAAMKEQEKIYGSAWGQASGKSKGVDTKPKEVDTAHKDSSNLTKSLSQPIIIFRRAGL
jgi:hypothetical protein